MNVYGRRRKYESFRGTFETLKEMTLSFVTSETLDSNWGESLMKVNSRVVVTYAFKRK